MATYRRRVHIERIALIVEGYDDAIRFFVDALGFDLVEDSPAEAGRRSLLRSR